ncbi:chromosome segregation in meiosis- protein [Apophysomyces ossiformis]|uniref:Chromosome segregation in meiosis protein n=1 Tax=Apophysomyces ossiformis TaxID=679940 RepID=A0A8H7BI41_9FUNG|nr:chromosome segregation in meiosis- protein [Apophysomyces ossiformis]
MSNEGLKRIRHEAPSLRFRGKGYEEQDLQKLMEFYYMWANRLYPRLGFADFARKAMKACANKRCKIALAEWQQEFKDKNNTSLAAEIASDEERDITRERTQTPEPSEAPPLRTPSPIQPLRHDPLERNEHDNEDEDEQPLFSKAPDSSDAQDARARAAASRAAALERLAARRREKEQQQRQTNLIHDDEDMTESQQQQSNQIQHDEDMFEEDPGAEYLDDM